MKEIGLLELAFRVETAVAVLTFTHFMPLPLPLVFVLAAMTLLVVQLSQNKVCELKCKSSQIIKLLGWGALNGMIGLIGIISYVWLKDGRIDGDRVAMIFLLTVGYGLYFCVVRLSMLLFSKVFARNSKK
jgi:hypothetical protein